MKLRAMKMLPDAR